MAFSESGMFRLVESILRNASTSPSPLVLREYMRKAAEYFQRAPLYPGIVLQALSRTILPDSGKKSLEIGSRVFVNCDSRAVIGTVESIDSKVIRLKDVTECTNIESVSIDRSEIDLIVHENTLRDEWPGFYGD